MIELYGDYSGTAMAASHHVGRRCRESSIAEPMTIPRLPTKPAAAWGAR